MSPQTFPLSMTSKINNKNKKFTRDKMRNTPSTDKVTRQSKYLIVHELDNCIYRLLKKLEYYEKVNYFL